ncbi:hypothetical protein D3C73_1268350 [compost metagenome]
MQAVQTRAVPFGATVGGAEDDRAATLQAQITGQRLGDRHVGGPGIEHEMHSLAVDRAICHEMALAIAQQAHFDEAFAVLGLHLGIGVALARLPLTEKARSQKHRRRPGDDHQYPARTLARWLAHGVALQPPCGAANRQTTGRLSPSARSALLLSRPIHAPLASMTSASARPNG